MEKQTTSAPGTIRASFFDDPALASRPKFWLEVLPFKRRLSKNVVIEGELNSRSYNSSEALKPHHFVMYEDRILQFNNSKDRKDEGFILLELVVVELIKSKEKPEQPGFRLTSNMKAEDIYPPNATVYAEWHTAMRRNATFRDFNTNYTIQKAIGKGTFAVIYQAARNFKPSKEPTTPGTPKEAPIEAGSEFAIKSFDKRKFEGNDKGKLMLLNEINMMRKVDHPTIITLYEVYETDNHINLVVELLKGGELFDKVVEKGCYTERDTANLMGKLLSALEYLATKSIMHRDLKPENIILQTATDDTAIKIADFGLASFTDIDNPLFKRCGTPGYVAPEVLADLPYTEKVDIYSAGVIFYILIAGSAPFYGESYTDIILKNKQGDISFNFDECEIKPSQSAVSLMKAMLEKDHKKRITAKDALNHEWFVKMRNSGGVDLAPLVAAQHKISKFQEDKKLKIDIKRKPAGGDDMVSASPVITGKQSPVEEEKGHTFMDSPGMKPAVKTTKKYGLIDIKRVSEDNSGESDNKTDSPSPTKGMSPIGSPPKVGSPARIGGGMMTFDKKATMEEEKGARRPSGVGVPAVKKESSFAKSKTLKK